MLPRFHQPQAIDLTITSTITFNPHRCMIPFSDPKDPGTWIAKMGGKPVHANSAATMQRAWNQAESDSIGSDGGVTKITVSGTLRGKAINKEFNALDELKSFLEKEGFKIIPLESISPAVK